METTAYFIVILGVKLNQIFLSSNVDVMLLRCCLFSSVCFKYHFLVKKEFLTYLCVLSKLLNSPGFE
jgi:hypothetical protein